jgi:hypothetical protein
MIGKCNLFVAITAIIFVALLFGPVIIFGEEKVVNLQSVVLEDFELDANQKPKRTWIAEPNRFGRENNLESGKSLQKVAWVQAWPEAAFGKEGVFNDGNGDKPNKTSLGVQMSFNRQGYNTVDLFPVELKDTKYVKKPIDFQGRVDQIDMWIWGANFDYYVEMVLRDYTGYEHRLLVGSIKHIGWKNFAVKIPGYIPQSTLKGSTTAQQFALIKLVVGINPEEKCNGAFVYFDHIKYLTDLNETKYDGYNLVNGKSVNDLWDKAPKAPSDTDLKP